MRLGSCIALELAVVVGASAGAWIGASRGVSLAGDYFSAHEAAAATAGPAVTPARLPDAHLHVAAPAMPGTVFEAPDELLLAPLAATPVTRVKLNHGGTSLSLRLDFASGARAAFKPQQIHPQSDPRREIAAYRLDRLLGLGHVPPAKPVRFTFDDLVAAADPDARNYTTARLTDEAIVHDGVVRGVASWWIPEIRDAMIGTYHVEDKEGMALWTSYLQVGAVVPPEVKPVIEQLAACVLFDVLIDNSDRWTGSNTKVSPDRKTLYFMDNTLSFSVFSLGHATNLTPLWKIEVFPRGFVSRLRALTYASLSAAFDLGEDPAGLAPLLQPAEIRAVLQRRDHLLQYIDRLIAQYGEAAVLGFP